MFASIIVAFMLTMGAQQSDPYVYGHLVARGPGFILVRDHNAKVVPYACPPSWCKPPKVGRQVWVEATGFDASEVAYCPAEDACGNGEGGY